MLKVKEYSSFEAFEQDEHRQDIDLVAIVNKPNGMVCADLITDCKMWQTAVNRFFKALAGDEPDMTVLDHMKAAGYDPNAARNADDLRRMGAGTMECESIQLRTFRCRPYQYEGEMLAVEATAMVPFTDGTQRPYPDGWPSSIKASAMAFFRIKEDE